MSIETQIADLIKAYEASRNLISADREGSEHARYRSLNPIRSYSVKEKADLIKRFGEHMIGDWPDQWGTYDILKWPWIHEPTSIQIHDFEDVHPLTIWYCLKIDSLIQQADTIECVTSASEYIREAKKWMITHPEMQFTSLLEHCDITEDS